MFRVLRWAVCVAGISALLIVSQSAAQGDQPSKPRPLITVSKETTRILGPLDEYGYVDYLAALNQAHSRGVTPENNAAVLFRQAMGPGEISENIREKYYQMLRIARLPDDGDYFRSLNDHIEQLLEDGELQTKERPEWEILDEIFEQQDKACNTPWSSKEFPVVAGWLKVNEKPLQLLVEASRRPRYYAPLVLSSQPASMIEVLLPDITSIRNAARLLTARAMLRVHEGRIEAAWEDLMACRRLARLVGQGPTLIDALVSIAIDGMAVHAGTALAHHGTLTANQAREFQAQLRKLPPPSKLIDKIDVAERYMFLDAVKVMAQHGPDAFSGAAPTKRSALERMAMASVDWDKILRMGNSYYDRMVAAGRQPTRSQRQKALARFTENLEEERVAFLKRTYSPLAGKSLRNVLSGVMENILVPLLPSPNS